MTQPRATSAEMDLHERLLAGDSVAPSELAVTYLVPLGGWLTECNRGLDESICGEAAGEAILSLIKNPSSYDPTRLGLERYLRMSASGDLLNILARERRHTKGRQSLESVEHSVDARNPLGRDDDPSLPMQIEEERQAAGDDLPASLRDGLSEGDKKVLDLMRAGERKTDAFAKALGIDDIPAEEQRRKVKRVKDRLQKRLDRGGAND